MSDMTDREKNVNAAFYKAARPVFLGAAMIALTACSSVPDALNPAEWYRGTVEYFAGDGEDADPDQEAPQSATADSPSAVGSTAARVEAQADQQSFPDLSRVDQQRGQRNLGLSADPDRPRYAPAIARQGEDTSVAAAPEAPPAPTPSPVVPVAPASEMASAPAPTPAPVTAAAPVAAPKGDVPVAVPGVTQLAIATPADQQAEFERIRSRLKRQLADINAQAKRQPALSTGVAAPGLVSPLPTMVVSSAGVEQSNAVYASVASNSVIPGAAPASRIQPFDPAMGPLMENNGALPLPAGATQVATIVFPNGSARLTAEDRRILGQVAALQKQRGGTIRIVGHSSSRTKTLAAEQHRQVNLRVSKNRASTVANALQASGVAASHILTAAVSDSQPVFLEVMPTGEAGNRRAEIYLDF